MSAKKTGPKTTPSNYKRTEQDEALIDRMLPQICGLGPTIKVFDQSESLIIGVDHPDSEVGQLRLMEELGSIDPKFLWGLIDQLAHAVSTGRKIDEGTLNFMLSVVKGIKPKDQLEAMLAAQMGAIHAAMMTCAGQLAKSATIAQRDSAERALNKLARTFAMQMETLKRYRTGGEQKVTVQHVSVQEGGQAIVGNVTQAAPKSAANGPPASPPPLLTESKTAPMEVIGKPARAAVPIYHKAKR